MQLVTLQKGRTTRLFWLAAGLVLAVAALTAEQSDPAIIAAGFVVVLASLLPLYLWLLGWSGGLPIWPVFSLATGMTYALPMIQDSVALRGYTADEIIAGGMTFVGFVLLGTIVWASLTSRPPRPPRSLLMIEMSHSVRYLLLFVGAGLAFGLNQLTGLIPMPGNSMQVFRGITGSLSTMGLFVLAFYLGRGLLDKPSAVLFVAGAVATMLMNMTNLMLAQAAVPMAMVILGYILGGNRLPWRVLLLLFAVMAVLHSGKYQMRASYWSESESGGKQLTFSMIPAFDAEWFGFGLEELGGWGQILKGRDAEDAQSTLFQRSGNLHMLLLVQKKSPQEVPYCFGATYAPIPRLLIPRFLDDQKGISHAGNVMLSVNYGVLTIEGTQGTSIGWGLLPEAYANFGYLGIVGLALVLATFYSWITRMTVGVPMTALRFVIGLLMMGAATTADTMGVFVTSQFQAIIGVSLASMVVMRRQLNPFALKTGEEIKQIVTETGSNVGLPSPGILASLIKGQQPQVADQETAGQQAGTRQAADGAIVRT
ncbi:MAG: hypothetical protein JHC85_15120, partial [Chthoniobacterales bacterium]|nr:hypothetical protein [Chthoniobacterales bacterium]